MSVRRSLLALFCGLAVVAENPANANVLVNDDFTHPDGGLETQLPTPGPGIAWKATSNRGVNPVQVTSGEAVVRQIAVGGNSEDMANEFAPQSTTATTYARFDFRLPSADNAELNTDPDVADEGVFFLSLRGSGPSALRARTGILNSLVDANHFRLAINADSSNINPPVGAAIWPTELAFDTNYRAVISFDAEHDVSKLWLDPVNEASTNITQTGTVAAAINTQITLILLRQNDDYNGKQIIDNLAVATSFADALNPPLSLDGDYNHNFVVDAADYTIWRDTLGSTTDLRANGDNTLSSENLIDTADFDYWKAHFIGSPGSGGGSLSLSGVPEPATALLFALGLASLAIRRHVTG